MMTHRLVKILPGPLGQIFAEKLKLALMEGSVIFHYNRPHGTERVSLHKLEIGDNGVDIGEKMRLGWANGLFCLIMAGATLLVGACADSSSPPIVFVSDSGGDREIMIIDPETAVLTSLTDNDVADFAPTWSKDHRKIVYLSDESGTVEIKQVVREGEEPEPPGSDG